MIGDSRSSWEQAPDPSKVLQRYWVQANRRITFREYLVWCIASGALYAMWALVFRPDALDLHGYLFAGHAFREGISPYTESWSWHLLANQLKVSPVFAPYPYPPSFNLLSSLLTFMPFELVRLANLLVGIFVLQSSLWVLSTGVSHTMPSRWLVIAFLFFLPVLNCLAAGNIQVLLLGTVAAMMALESKSNAASSGARWGLDACSGVILGVSLALKPVLWPLVLWTIVRRRFGITWGCVLSLASLFAISVWVNGLGPWRDYLHALPDLTAVQSYVENQSILAWISRLGFADYAEVMKVPFAAAVIGSWFILYPKTKPSFELAALSALSVLVSPLAWYYYFIMLIPVFCFFLDSEDAGGVRSKLLLAAAYLLIQLHGIVWSRVANWPLNPSLAMWGMVILAGMVFYHAYTLNRERRIAALVVEN